MPNTGFVKWVAVAGLAITLGASGSAFAQGNGHGRGRGHDKRNDADDSARQDTGYYRDDDRRAMHDWYAENTSHLPPGLAKKDRLPPGLEKQLIVRGQLPPGLQKKIQPAPEEIVRRLPPPPPDCENVVIGGHMVLLNRKTSVVVAVFHFEL